MNIEKVHNSYKDPSGFMITRDGIYFRVINDYYKKCYDYLLSSKLYDRLIEDELLIKHEEIEKTLIKEVQCYKIIKPEQINFISYPYEWCFSQLKDAAILTLKIQKIAMEYGMSLKDASAYNIQFVNGKPILIDTLSYEIAKIGEPWLAYNQFCKHFIAPLALMSFKDARLYHLLKIYLDGIPLELASKMLPFYCKLKPSIFLHITLHSKFQKSYAKKVNIKSHTINMSPNSKIGLIDNLASSISSLKISKNQTEWQDYYSNDSNLLEYLNEKQQIISHFLDKVNPKVLIDVGANDGLFSRLAASKNINVISCDLDEMAIENNYNQNKKNNIKNILPIIIDISNPSPSIGWECKELTSFVDRGKTELVLALALIHHLVISKNIPIDFIAEYFYKNTCWLIIEFIPKTDPKVQFLLRSREDIFKDYNKMNFEEVFSKYFQILEERETKNTGRIIYLMKKK